MRNGKVQSLIDRALHPRTPVEEARTSAIIALRQAVSQGLLSSGIRLEPQVDKRALEDAEATGYARGIVEGVRKGIAEGEKRASSEARRIGFDEGRAVGIVQGAAEAMDKARRAYQEGFDAGRAEALGHISVDVEAFGRMPEAKPSRARKIIQAKYAGSCNYCGVYWDVGEPIAWAKGRGATCVNCQER